MYRSNKSPDPRPRALRRLGTRQLRSGFEKFLAGVLDNVPGINGIVDMLVGATTTPYQLTATQLQNIESSWLNQTGHGFHDCFSGPLTSEG